MNRCLSLPLLCSAKDEAAATAESSFAYKVFHSINDVSPELWDNILPAENLLMGRSYVHALEKSTDSDVQFLYLVVHRNNIPVALGFFQLITFRGANVENDGLKQERSLINYLNHAFRKVVVGVVNRISLKLLVSGNCYVTGECGFYFSPLLRSDSNLSEIVNDCIEQIVKESNENIAGVLVKDYYEKEKISLEGLANDSYLEFNVNPNMILDLRPGWKSFEDYLGDMASKYRTRMRKALKRSEGITAREMDAAELRNKISEMSGLYNDVVDEAAFKLTKLNIESFYQLKQNLGEKFGAIGFFKEGEMVSFITYYLHENDLVAGYMGMKRSLNQEHDLYLNVLLTLAETGISRGMKRVIYGRTAMEIKSSVGAVPHSMYLYVKHRSALVNFVIRQVVKFLSKDEKWTLRSPFKG